MSREDFELFSKFKKSYDIKYITQISPENQDVIKKYISEKKISDVKKTLYTLLYNHFYRIDKLFLVQGIDRYKN